MPPASYSVILEPLDPLLFGDSRSARAGEEHLLLDQDPTPLTFYGALGAWVLEHARKQSAAPPTSWPPVLGARMDADALLHAEPSDVPVLRGYCLRDASGKRWFPNPELLRWFRPAARGEVCERLTPTTRGGLESSSPFAEVLSGKPDEERSVPWVPETALEDVLCGGEPGNPGHQTLFKTEVRPGLAIDDETGRAADQMLFSRPYRRFEPGSPDPRHGSLGAGFEAWYETREHFSEPPTPAIGFLGGDRRRARFTWQETPEPLVEVREAVLAALEEQAAETQGFLLYLVTPMIAVDDLAAVSVAVAGRIYEPVCAAIGKPAYASGWDTKWNRPRPILALVPAGSVFFYRWGSGERPSPEGLIDQLWLTAISPHGGSVGFGRVLVGVW